MLEEVAREKMELNKKHYEEVERAKLVLDKLQTTYQTQVIEYEAQAHAVAKKRACVCYSSGTTGVLD